MTASADARLTNRNVPAGTGRLDNPRPTNAARGGYARQHLRMWEGPGRLRCKVAGPIRVRTASAIAGTFLCAALAAEGKK